MLKRCFWFKLMSVGLCLGIFLASVQIMPVFSEQDEIVHQLRSASNGDALAEMMHNLTGDEIQTLGVDLTDYNKLKYPKYACSALIEKEWTDAQQFAQAFGDVMAEMLYEKTVSRTFSVFYREDGEADLGALPLGITFKTNQQINAARGKAVFSYDIENKNALVSGQIDLHLGAWTSSADTRSTYLQGYAMAVSPFTGEDKAYYSQETEEYKLWNTFMNQSGLWAGANLQFRYANAQENRNCIVDIPAEMLDTIKAGDTSSLILYYGGGSNLYLDSVSSALRLTYDKTVLLYSEDGGHHVAATRRAFFSA